MAAMTPAMTHAAEPKTFKLAHMFAKGSLPDRTAEKFADSVAAKSRGSIQVKVLPEGLLGDERENLAQLRKGILQFSITGDVVVSNIGDKYRVVNMPFLYHSPAHALEVYGGAFGDAIRANIRQEGVEVLSWHYVGTRMLTANKPIRTAADLKGLLLRLPTDSAWVATWQALGVEPRQVQFTELAAALKLGRVEAQENPPNFIRANRLYENQRYLMATNHMPQRQMVLASGEFWRKLGEKDRHLLDAAAREASDWATSRAIHEHKIDLAWLTREGGMTLIEFDRRGVVEAIAGVPAVLAGGEGDKIYQKIQALR